MKKFLSFLLGIVFLGVMTGCNSTNSSGSVPDDTQKEPEVNRSVYIYMSHDGDDLNDGTTPEKSIASFERAIELQKNYQESMPEGKDEIIIEVGAGSYYFDKRVKISPTDTKGVPVTVRGSSEGETEFTGGVTYKGGWTAYKDGIYSLKLADDTLSFRQLYVNGNPAQRARLQKTNTESKIVWDKKLKRVGINEVLNGVTLSADGTLPKELQQAEIVVLKDWAQVNGLIKKAYKDGSNTMFEVNDLIAQNLFNETAYPGMQTYFPVWLENSLAFLDEENEWFYDEIEKTLYYKPASGTDIEQMVFTVPQTESLIYAQGYKSGRSFVRPSDINFENICFRYTNWNQPSEQGYADMQSCIIMTKQRDNPNLVWDRGAAAVTFHFTNNFRVNNCVFENLGFTGLDIRNGSKNTVVQNSQFLNIAGNGIMAGFFTESSEYYFASPLNAPTSRETITESTVIKNNLVKNIGLSYRAGTGIVGGYASGLEVVNNEVCFTAYSGIALGWGWANTADGSYMSGYKINNNYIHDAMTSELFDGADIYLLGNHDANGEISEIKNNYIVCSGGSNGNGGGLGSIYFDENSSEFLMENNYIVGMGSQSWLFMHDLNSALHDICVKSSYITVNKSFSITKGNGNHTARGVSVENPIVISTNNLPNEVQNIILNAGMEEKNR